MTSVVENVSSVAVWGSLGASTVLGAYMLVQCVIDAGRRYRYLLFSLACAGIALIDAMHPYLEPMVYEQLRLVAWSLYAPTVLVLFKTPLTWVIGCLVGLLTVSALAWHVQPEAATTTLLPLSFSIAAIAHARLFHRRCGFASAILATVSASQAALCSIYYLLITEGSQLFIGVGYLQYVSVSVAAVLFGWVNLPRELRGRAPVKVSLKGGYRFAAVFLGAEIVICAALLRGWLQTILIADLVQLVSLLVFYFHHRHNLVIYAENVTALLEERTESLRSAQRELSVQNELQAEKLAEQARDLEAKAQVIDRQRRLELAAQTAGQAAHDIQNLTSPILSGLSEIERAPHNPQQLQSIVRRVRERVDDLLTLNSQMLALARRGRLDFAPIRCKEVLESLTEYFPEERARLKTNAAADVWLEGAHSQLIRAVSNLVRNALDALPSGRGTVEVRCGRLKLDELRRCHLGFLRPGAYAYFTITDTGSGIPREHLEQIFEPFFSLKTSGSSGSGLGLSIVAGVVEDHGGVLDLETSTQGTTFTLYFPEVPPADQVIDLNSLCGNETVLVTEDDSAIRERSVQVLTKAGYHVLTAEDGIEAIRLLQAQHADLLLLDMSMPRMNGAETYFAAMQLRPGIRAVIYSAYLTESEKIRMQELGVGSFLAKPASPAALLREIRLELDAGTTERHAAGSSR